MSRFAKNIIELIFLNDDSQTHKEVIIEIKETENTIAFSEKTRR